VGKKFAVGNFTIYINGDPTNIVVDICHPAVGLRYIIQPRHLCELKTHVISLT
jgi:hypothetical protein